MLIRNGVEAKHLRCFVAALLKMTGLLILLGALNVVAHLSVRQGRHIGLPLR
jgi:hypothetical protein